MQQEINNFDACVEVLLAAPQAVQQTSFTQGFVAPMEFRKQAHFSQNKMRGFI